MIGMATLQIHIDFCFQFKFNSYSAGDDDYEGYDYSLQGHLSAVRIVFLYRFVQEVCSKTQKIWSQILKLVLFLFLMLKLFSF